MSHHHCVALLQPHPACFTSKAEPQGSMPLRSGTERPWLYCNHIPHPSLLTWSKNRHLNVQYHYGGEDLKCFAAKTGTPNIRAGHSTVHTGAGNKQGRWGSGKYPAWHGGRVEACPMAAHRASPNPTRLLSLSYCTGKPPPSSSTSTTTSSNVSYSLMHGTCHAFHSSGSRDK